MAFLSSIEVPFFSWPVFTIAFLPPFDGFSDAGFGTAM